MVPDQASEAPVNKERDGKRIVVKSMVLGRAVMHALSI